MLHAITTKKSRDMNPPPTWQGYGIWGSMLLCLVLSYLYWLLVRSDISSADIQGRLPVYLWSGLVVLHAALGTVAMVLAWQDRSRLLNKLVYIYFIAALILHTWVFLDYTNLDEKIYQYYQAQVHPQDVALHQKLDQNPINYESVSTLLKEGANANSKRKTWAIWKAYQQNNYRIMQLLLEHGAKADQPSPHQALSFRIDGPLKRVLSRPERDTTLLCEIIEQRQGGSAVDSLDIVQYLLKAGADPQQLCLKKENPVSIISLAVTLNDVDVLKTLYQSGSRVSLVQDRKLIRKRLSDGAQQGNQAMLDVLLKMLPNKESLPALPGALTQAVLGGHADAALDLLKAGAKAERKDFIALSIEKCNGHLGLVRALLASGLDPNINNSHNKTPLALAFERKDLYLLDLLITAGADVNRANVQYGLLHHIFKLDAKLHIPFAKRLIAAKANLERRDADDYTFLMRAAYLKDNILVSLALNNGADPKAVTSGIELTAAQLALKENADTALLAQLGMTNQPDPTSKELVSTTETKLVKQIVTPRQREIDIQAENDQGIITPEVKNLSNQKNIDIINTLEVETQSIQQIDNDTNPLVVETQGNQKSNTTMNILETETQSIQKINNITNTLKAKTQDNQKSDIDMNILEIETQSIQKINNNSNTLEAETQDNRTNNNDMNTLEVESQTIQQSNNGMNALEAATRRNQKEKYLAILKQGANPNIMIKDGSPLLDSHKQIIINRAHHIRALNSSDDPAIPILAAAALAGNIDVMKALLAANADPNARAANGDRALHLIAIAGATNGRHQSTTTQLLAKSGANINAVNSKGYTPITLAAHHHAIPMIEALVRLKVDLNVPDRQGRTVLGQTLRNGYVHEHIKLLLKLGAKPTQDDLAFVRSHSKAAFLLPILEAAAN